MAILDGLQALAEPFIDLFGLFAEYIAIPIIIFFFVIIFFGMQYALVKTYIKIGTFVITNYPKAKDFINNKLLSINLQDSTPETKGRREN